MEILSLKLMGNSGVNSDVAPFELPPEFLSSGVNFKALNGSLSPAGGSRKTRDTPGGSAYGFVKHISAKGSDFWVIASRYAVWMTEGGTAPWVDISSRVYGVPDGGQYDWVGSQLGQILVMNNPSLHPEYLLPSGDKLEVLPFSPTETWQDRNLSCRTMRVHKNFLMAMNLTGTEDEPNGFRFSHPAAENGIPYTWDTTDRSSIAVKGQLGSDGGQIVDGLTLRDTFVMYSQNSIDNFSFNPSSEFYWSRKELSSTVGLLAQRCLTEVKGTHFLIVDGDIVTNNGSAIASIMYKRLLKRFNARTNEYTAFNSYVARNDIDKEVWFCVPEDDSVTASTAYVYNWKDDSWAIRDLPENTAHIGYGRNPGEESTSAAITWESLKAAVGESINSWASFKGVPWGRRIVGSRDDRLVGVDTSGNLSDVDPLGPIDGDTFNMSLERLDFPLLDHVGTVAITRVFPTATGGPFIMQLGIQNFAGGPVTWGGEHTFDPGTDRYFDIRMTGELLCYRIKSINDIRFSFSGARIQILPAGLR
ncbi:hypothetical protein DRQ25_10040 [Candidatus Fermentibacteria bacterium]|nr:MAG: hypothetical protein DRQ25_10040 [Candidatus Fermentibacteria bacterium]